MIVLKDKKGIPTWQHKKLSGTPSKSEAGEAKDFYQEFEFRWPEVAKTTFHVTNEGKRSWNSGKELKKAGLKTGVSDYITLYPCGGFNFLVIELKRANGGSPDADQKQFIKDCIDAGGYACVAHGREAAITVVEKYFSGDLKL